jgi:DNA invertase Pin-like site-specific DNA recombinase
LAVLGGLAEFERELIVSRKAEGCARAKTASRSSRRTSSAKTRSTKRHSKAGKSTAEILAWARAA